MRVQQWQPQSHRVHHGLLQDTNGSAIDEVSEQRSPPCYAILFILSWQRHIPIALLLLEPDLYQSIFLAAATEHEKHAVSAMDITHHVKISMAWSSRDSPVSVCIPWLLRRCCCLRCWRRDRTRGRTWWNCTRTEAASALRGRCRHAWPPAPAARARASSLCAHSSTAASTSPRCSCHQ